MASAEIESVLGPDPEDRLGSGKKSARKILSLAQKNSTQGFNGMSEEAFRTGSKVVDGWKEVPRLYQVEALPHVIQHLTYETLGAEASSEQLRQIAAELQQAAANLSRAADSLDDRSRTMDLSPDEY